MSVAAACEPVCEAEACLLVVEFLKSMKYERSAVRPPPPPDRGYISDTGEVCQYFLQYNSTLMVHNGELLWTYYETVEMEPIWLFGW